MRHLQGVLRRAADPVGMLATHGQIRQPPILSRATLIRSGAGWSVRRLGVDDLAIDLPDGTTVLPGTSGGSVLRYRGQGAARERPPASGATLEVLPQGRSDERFRTLGAMDATGPDRPTGCTLSELADVLAEAGAVDALTCDGGGSAQVFRGAGAVLASSDSRAVGGALFDRPVPVAACVR
jgi:hypothetical protein